MTTVVKDLAEVKKLVYDAIDACSQSGKSEEIDVKLHQNLNIPEGVWKGRDGKVTIIQSGSISINIVNNLTMALQKIDAIMTKLTGADLTKEIMESLFLALLESGITFKELKDSMAAEYVKWPLDIARIRQKLHASLRLYAVQ